MTTELTNMTPQATPLYAVAEHVDGVDLFLVVSWKPVNATHAMPVMVVLASTDARPSTGAETYHTSNGEELQLQFHDRLVYHNDRAEARQDYDEAAFTWRTDRDGSDEGSPQ